MCQAITVIFNLYYKYQETILIYLLNFGQVIASVKNTKGNINNFFDTCFTCTSYLFALFPWKDKKTRKTIFVFMINVCNLSKNIFYLTDKWCWKNTLVYILIFVRDLKDLKDFNCDVIEFYRLCITTPFFPFSSDESKQHRWEFVTSFYSYYCKLRSVLLIF